MERTSRGLVERALGLAMPSLVTDYVPPPRQVAADLWVIDRRLRFGAITIPTRATLVKLAHGGGLLHSPVPLDAAARRRIESLCAVTCLVAPNSFHYRWMRSGLEAYPAAEVYLAPGLGLRRPGVPAGATLGDTAPSAWTSVLDQAVFGPVHGLSEVVFYHRATRTLVLTDLAFNVRTAATRWERWYWQASGEWRRFGPSRTVRLTLLRDPLRARTFAARLLAWPFERIVVAHGDVLERDATRAFRAAFERFPSWGPRER